MLASYRTTALLIALALAGCAPRGPADGQPDVRGEQAPSAPKSLTIASDTEPKILVTSMGGGQGTGLDFDQALHWGLATYDHRGEAQPYLAVELPSTQAGTWLVRADGTMRTTFRLHPNITWHDGVPLKLEDFVLAWTITRDPELPMSDRVVASLIDRIDTPDATTLALEWSKSYAFANAIVRDQLSPLPTHLLEAEYRGDKQRFQNLPYFTREFVGVGPYRLHEWEPGSHLVLKAYDRFFKGRAKIDTIIVRFIPNSQTIVANLLSGTVDGYFRGLTFDEFILVKREWETAGKRPLALIQTSSPNMLGVQFRIPDPVEITDVRVRRALLHAIDRQALVDAVLGGLGPVAHTIYVAPDEARWEWVQDVIVRYEYDPRRAEAALAEIGWRRSPGGPLQTSRGEQVRIPLQGRAGGEKDAAIIADFWKALGIAVDQVILSRAEQSDSRIRASYPGFEVASLPRPALQRAYGPDCPSEASRWVGSNRGCYQNPQMDHAVEGLAGAIDPADRRRFYRDLVRVQTEDLPVLPLFFTLNEMIYREGVTGPNGQKPYTTPMWNVLDWDVK